MPGAQANAAKTGCGKAPCGKIARIGCLVRASRPAGAPQAAPAPAPDSGPSRAPRPQPRRRAGSRTRRRWRENRLPAAARRGGGPHSGAGDSRPPGRRFVRRDHRFASLDAGDSRPGFGASRPDAADSLPPGRRFARRDRRSASRSQRFGAGDSRLGVRDSRAKTSDSPDRVGDSSPELKFFRCPKPFKTRGFADSSKFFSALRQKRLEMPHCGIICA